MTQAQRGEEADMPPGRTLVGRTLRIGTRGSALALAQGKIGLPAAFDGFEIRNKRGFVALWISAD